MALLGLSPRVHSPRNEGRPHNRPVAHDCCQSHAVLGAAPRDALSRVAPQRVQAQSCGRAHALEARHVSEPLLFRSKALDEPVELRVAALLDEDTAKGGDVDLAKRPVDVKRLAKRLGKKAEGTGDALGAALAVGFRDLIAQRRGDASYGGTVYLLANGKPKYIHGGGHYAQPAQPCDLNLLCLRDVEVPGPLRETAQRLFAAVKDKVAREQLVHGRLSHWRQDLTDAAAKRDAESQGQKDQRGKRTRARFAGCSDQLVQ